MDSTREVAVIEKYGLCRRKFADCGQNDFEVFRDEQDLCEAEGTVATNERFYNYQFTTNASSSSSE